MIIKMYVCTMLILLLVIIMMLVYYSKHIKYNNLSPVECGFESMSVMRRPFSVRFFMMVILFLVFDVEVVLIFPTLFNNIMNMSMYMQLNLYIFLVILLYGLLFEWKNGMLDWVK
uniref:NADH dehydrogenase subunit 3 n=1 Tax=Cochlostyla marinduquensis TaxID=2079772 RepID=UPI00233EEEAE|nr:NADH dehydrogenase subunit 3 [Cochlostyla marinduquensis]UIX22055.1 NADH dehydrogenase subunit 3 [Cochlostyla marinduquensis]